MRERLIADALTRRFNELRGRVFALAPESFGEMSAFVSQVRERLRDVSPDELKKDFSDASAFRVWAESDDDCLSALRRLASGEPVHLRPGQPPPLAPFLQLLSSAGGREPEASFRLLAERYVCPLNFAHPAEDEARERVLTRLMSQDRARVERASLEAVGSDDLLLRLNLIAVQAALRSDLRFLDALNYYYELLPGAWQPRGQQRWLLVSYLALYARALVVWTSER